jgi:hypothetical protein
MKEYKELVEQLKIEFGDFLVKAQKGLFVRHMGLRARKKSILLRKLLKKFREYSLKNEQRINAIVNEAKVNKMILEIDGAESLGDVNCRLEVSSKVIFLLPIEPDPER